MISNNQIKFVKSLHQKKFRSEHGLFLAEGRKMYAEAVKSGVQIHSIYSVDETLLTNQSNSYHINQTELEKISALKTPQDVVMVIRQPQPMNLDEHSSGAMVALDRVRDPGNLGTILRTADWFGISAVICSPDCVEVYNPKVVQASMGSVFRMPVIISELQLVLDASVSANRQILIADMAGESPQNIKMKNDCLILIGNEAQGVSKKLDTDKCTTVSIDSFGESESLNASIACAILCYEYRRNLPRLRDQTSPY